MYYLSLITGFISGATTWTLALDATNASSLLAATGPAPTTSTERPASFKNSGKRGLWGAITTRG